MKNWAAKAFSKNPGALHRDTNTPQDQTIPKSKLRAAMAGRYGKKAKQRAVPVINVQK